MKKYEVLIKDKKYGWCLECLANEENYQRILNNLKAQHPDKEFTAKEITEEENKNAWWNQGYLD